MMHPDSCTIYIVLLLAECFPLSSAACPCWLLYAIPNMVCRQLVPHFKVFFPHDPDDKNELYHSLGSNDHVSSQDGN